MSSLLKSLFLHLAKAITIIAILVGFLCVFLIIISEGYQDFVINHPMYLLINIVLMFCSGMWTWTKILKRPDSERHIGYKPNRPA